MKQPKFKIGEVVIYKASKLEVEYMQGRIAGALFTSSSGWEYRLEAIQAPILYEEELIKIQK